MKKIWAYFIMLVLLASCAEESGSDDMAEIILDFGKAETKAIMPDEEKVSDLNVLLYNSSGSLEESRYLSGSTLRKRDGRYSLSMRIMRGLQTSIVCCANLGYPLEKADVPTLSSMLGKRFWLNYPDEYPGGIPATGIVTRTFTADDKEISIPMTRLMSKISVRMDRTSLAPGIEMRVRTLKVGNCPRSALLLGKSYARTKADVFASGFTLGGKEVDPLNTDETLGISKEVSAYMLENMQGTLLENVTDDDGKVLDDVPVLSQVCSYLELGIEYTSDDFSTPPGKYLKYRFYLGENLANFDVERGCHYHYTICPDGDGLGSE